MNLKIRGRGMSHLAGNWQVFNEETGAVISNVSSFTLKVAVNDVPRCNVELVLKESDIEVEVDGAVFVNLPGGKRYRIVEE